MAILYSRCCGGCVILVVWSRLLTKSSLTDGTIYSFSLALTAKQRYSLGGNTILAKFDGTWISIWTQSIMFSLRNYYPAALRNFSPFAFTLNTVVSIHVHVEYLFHVQIYSTFTFRLHFFPPLKIRFYMGSSKASPNRVRTPTTIQETPIHDTYATRNAHKHR